MHPRLVKRAVFSLRLTRDQRLQLARLAALKNRRPGPLVRELLLGELDRAYAALEHSPARPAPSTGTETEELRFGESEKEGVEDDPEVIGYAQNEDREYINGSIKE